MTLNDDLKAIMASNILSGLITMNGEIPFYSDTLVDKALQMVDEIEERL